MLNIANAPNTLQLATQHHQASRLRRAETLYRQLLTQNPRDPNVLHLLGILALQSNKPEVAADLIAQSLAAAPPDPARFCQWAHLHRQLNRLPQAEELCRKAIAIQPNYFDAHFLLGNLLKQQHRLDEATTAYQSALALNPDHLEAHCNLGVVLHDSGRLDEALQSFLHVVKLSTHPRYLQPKFAIHHYNLGSLLQKIKQYDLAMDCYRRAIALDPNPSQPYEALGIIHEILGQKDLAADMYKKALARGVHSPEALFHMAGITGENIPPAPPTPYITKLFDSMADNFEINVVDKLHYCAPQLIHEDLLAYASKSNPSQQPPTFGDILDLGCGTGLCGALLKPHAKSLHGVDISPAMMEKARQRNIYDQLILQEIAPYMLAHPHSFDLAISADVFIYVGDLEPSFAALATTLRPAGLFGLSVERHEPTGYTLRPTRRYAHSLPYLRALAAKHGFTEISTRTAPIRDETPHQVLGLIMILRK